MYATLSPLLEALRSPIPLPKMLFTVCTDRTRCRKVHICSYHKVPDISFSHCVFVSDCHSRVCRTVFSIDGSMRGNASRFANHSCNPNMISIEVWIESHDTRLPRVAFFALRDILPGEELTYDYMYGETSVVPSGDEEQNRIMCRCGAPNCRGYLWG